jgi:hypothetical protein
LPRVFKAKFFFWGRIAIRQHAMENRKVGGPLTPFSMANRFGATLEQLKSSLETVNATEATT